MENFNELFEKAAIVADHRTKVFNQLIEKTKLEILPRFCEACKNFELSNVRFTLINKPTSFCKKQVTEEGEAFYCLELSTNDCELTNIYKDTYTGNYKDDNNCSWYKLSEVEFYKSGIVEFIKVLNNRLSDYIKKYTDKISEAENLL